MKELEKETGTFIKFNDTLSALSGEDFANLSKELGQIDKDIEEKEDRWLELSEWA